MKLYALSEALDISVKQMTSGAGHDAQMFARVCPAAMILFLVRMVYPITPPNLHLKGRLKMGVMCYFK